MSYNGIILRKSISISKIYSIHYFEYMSDFSFEGESHDFWEFLCVDKGEVIVTADTERSVLRHGEITFHQPNEFHNVRATGEVAPNLVVISFRCEDKAMAFSEGRHSRSTKQSAISLPISSAKQDAASTAGWMTHTCRTCRERNRSCSAPNS